MRKAGFAPGLRHTDDDDEHSVPLPRRAPFAEEELHTQRQFLRLALGMRQQQVVGGPQHARTMCHAAAVGGFARYALNTGCRACDAVEAPPETMKHVFLECGAVRHLMQFRCDVSRVIRSLQRLYARIGSAAAPVLTFLANAQRAVTSYQAADDQWSDLMALVGASIPECGAPPGRERHVKQLTDRPAVMAVRALQTAFLGRLQDWTRQTEGRRWRQQKKWDHKEWLRLVLCSWRGAVRVDWAAIASVRWSRAETLTACSVGACLQYVRLVLRPLRAEHVARCQEAERRRRARARLRFYLRKHLRVVARDRLLQRRHSQRGDRVVSRTRGATSVARINYAERGATRRPYRSRSDLYKTRRWPRRDSIGVWAHAASVLISRGGQWSNPP